MQGVKFIVDNTFTPMILSPAKWGADVVVHSLTKFISGASDVVAGAIVALHPTSFLWLTGPEPAYGHTSTSTVNLSIFSLACLTVNYTKLKLSRACIEVRHCKLGS